MDNEPIYLQHQRELSTPNTKGLNDMLVYINTLKNVAYVARELVKDPTMQDRRAALKELRDTLTLHYGKTNI